MAKICRNNKNAVSSTNYLESEKKEEEIVDMYSLSSAAASEEPLIVKIEGQLVDMNTGADKSIMEKFFKENLVIVN